MKSILMSLRRWIKDPFGREKLTHHSEVIANIYETRALTEATSLLVSEKKKERRRIRTIRSGHAFERAMLGNSPEQRK